MKFNHTDRQLITLAVPMILSNITVPILGLVDTAVIGHLSHAYFLGGSTVGAMIITFITWLCGFLRMSTSGLSANAFGKQDSAESLNILIRGLVVAGLIGLAFIIFQSFYLDLALMLSGGSEQVQYYARQYAEIRIWGLPAALANIVILGWLLGQHKAKWVMWLLIVTNLVNLVLDLWFVLGLGWQVKGVAFATLISEYVALTIGLVTIFAHSRRFIGSVDKFKSDVKSIVVNLLEPQALAIYFKFNRDILIRTLCLEICFVFITFQGAKLGDNVVAANAILMNFLLLISFGLDGIANAAEALVGKAKGAGAHRRLHYIVKRSLLWTLGFALIYALIFALFGQQLIWLISDIPEVVQLANQHIGWMIVLPLVACWCFLFDGVYIGLLRAQAMRNSMLISTFVCFFPLWWLLQSLGNQGLWAAFSGFMLARGITLWWHYQVKLKPRWD